MFFKIEILAVLLIVAIGCLSIPVTQLIMAVQKSGNLETASNRNAPVVLPSSNLILTTTNYDIIYTTSKAGILDKVELEFPSSFDLSQVRLIGVSGIGSGLLSASKEKLTYHLIPSTNILPGMNIRLEIGGIVNGVSQKNKVNLTTVDSTNKVIEGPISSETFSLTAVGWGMISGGTIDSAKIDESFIKFGKLTDGLTGWNPNGLSKTFTITDNGVSSSSIVLVTLDLGRNTSSFGNGCAVDLAGLGKFIVACTRAPSQGTSLNYIVVTKK
jgi:hypothetical protein